MQVSRIAISPANTSTSSTDLRLDRRRHPQCGFNRQLRVGSDSLSTHISGLRWLIELVGEGRVTRTVAGHDKSNKSNGSASERGYRFQFALTKLILQCLRPFRSVTAKKMSGDIITLDNFAQAGRDGGMDMVIEIQSTSRKSALQTASRLKKVMKGIGQ